MTKVAIVSNITLLYMYVYNQSFLVAQILPADSNPTAVFSNNELNLQEIDVYGFDYDYTLASYKESLNYLLYNLGRDALIKSRKVIAKRFADL